MHKHIANCLLKTHGIPVVPGICINENEYNKYCEETLQRIIRELDYPLFVKPADSRSSAGIKGVAYDYEKLNKCIKEAFNYSKEVLIEKFIDTKEEINCVVIGNENEDNVECSKLSKIKPKGEFYTIDEKYPLRNIRNNSLDYKPVELTTNQYSLKPEITSLAKKVFSVLRCTGLVRIDFFVDKNDNIYFNEVNTIPGKTLCEASGWNFANKIKELIELAEEQYNKENETAKHSKVIDIQIGKK